MKFLSGATYVVIVVLASLTISLSAYADISDRARLSYGDEEDLYDNGPVNPKIEFIGICLVAFALYASQKPREEQWRGDLDGSGADKDYLESVRRFWEREASERGMERYRVEQRRDCSVAAIALGVFIGYFGNTGGALALILCGALFYISNRSRLARCKSSEESARNCLNAATTRLKEYTNSITTTPAHA